MPKLPPDISKLAKKLRFIRGTKVPVYKILDTLATPDGDISKVANKYHDVTEPALRDSLHTCARLLRLIETHTTSTAATSPVKSPEQTLSAAEAGARLKEVDRIKVFVDGSTKGNPGPSAFGYIIMDVKDTILLREGSYIGEATNNIAEAQGIIAALSRAIELGKKKVHMFCDSELMVNQINGSYRIRNPELMKLHRKISTLRKRCDVFEIVRIDRGLNKEADKLANTILKQALEEKLEN